MYTSCGLYSFSGASIAEEVNTVCINYIQNEAKLIEPNLENKFTEALITKCQTVPHSLYQLTLPNFCWKMQTMAMKS